MGSLEGTMKRLHIDSVRKDLKYYARFVDENAIKTERYSVALARETEKLDTKIRGSDIAFKETANQHTTMEDDSGNKLLKQFEICDNGVLINIALGCGRVPLTPDIVKRHIAYGEVKPSLLKMYDEVENIDGIFLFDVESNMMVVRAEYRFENTFDFPGLDMTTLYDNGVIWYDWFKTSDRNNNPERRPLWSKEAFIAVEHDWIMNLKVPFYRDRYTEQEKMFGIVAVHYNLDWMAANTIGKSAEKMMIVKDDSTLIGLNRPAEEVLGLETYGKAKFSSMNGFDPASTLAKKKFVRETLNLEHGKSGEIVSLARKLKSEFRFCHTIADQTYTVLREKAPELGLNFIALLPVGG